MSSFVGTSPLFFLQYSLISSVFIIIHENENLFAYKLQASLSEEVGVDEHDCHTFLKFGVKAKDNQDKIPTLYWLPKLHKNKTFKARFIVNSSFFVRQHNYIL